MTLRWFLLIAIDIVLGYDIDFIHTAPPNGCTAPDVIGRCTGNAKIDLVFLIDTA